MHPTVIGRASAVPHVRSPEFAQAPSVRRSVRQAVSVKSSGFLERVAAELRREIAAINKLDCALVERDIVARRREASLGRRWAGMRARIQKELERQGVSEADWCKRELDCDIRTMRRRVQLARGWSQYESARRDAGSDGQFGLVYGLSLISAEPTARAMNGHRSGHRLSVRSTADTMTGSSDTSRCQFITGDALVELRKLKSGTVNTIITSPAYWPIKRTYGGSGIGYEATVTEYLGNIVEVMHDAKRVLKDTGTLWIVVGDSYSRPTKFWTPVTQTVRRPAATKNNMTGRIRIQGGDRPTGSLLMIPSRLAIALQDDGWILRQAIVWDKIWKRPETVKDRATQTYEMVYMFVKKSEYFYDQDALRVPSVSSYGTPWQTKGRHNTPRY